ncbi:MAG: hypothetical protein JW776_14645, partial [Candidatus Lokiarchaeota archaeon]|nr:hypothetical protein [Candidatus Lokiarchaeota archaeon]
MEQLMVIQKTVFLVCASALIYPSLHAQTIQPSQAGLNSVISATRFIDSPKYTPGSAIQIKILINNPCGQIHDVWIKEDVPSGCTVKSTNPAAVIGQKALTWRFSIHPGITTINYSLNIPYFFNEALQFHGHVNYVIIEGVAKVQCDFGHFSDMADWGTSDFLPQIGKFKVKGKVLTRKLDNSYVYDLFGNGDHIYATQDEGLYIYTTRAGSWCFSGKFIWVNPGTSKLKPQLGIMIRESGRSSVSKHYSILLSPYRRTDIINDCLCVIKWREFTKGNTEQLPIPEAEILGNVNNMDPAWILSQDFYFRVTRVSHLNLFISEWSQDGINWFFANSQIIKMNEPLSYGLVISNQNDSSQLSHGRVSGISFQPASPFAIRSLGADFYQPNDMINVSLELINPTTQTVHVNLEEKIPPGWLIGQTSNDGIHQDGRISWSIAASPGEKQLQYTVLASEGFAEFSGFASRHKIIGDNRLVEMRSLYNKESFKNWIFWHTTDGLSNTSLNRIIVNSTNTIFVEDMNHAGWNRLDGFHVSHIPSPNGNEIIRESPSGQIWSVSCADSDENRIFSGFLEYHKSNWILHATDKFLDLNYISFDLCEPNKIYVLFNDRLVEWNVSTQIMT